MRLSKRDLKALAREARKLAFQCAEGRAPVFGTGREFTKTRHPCCPMGHVAYRGGLRGGFYDSPLHEVLSDAHCSTDLWWEVTSINDDQSADQRQRCERLPLALLAVADELENAARKSRPQRQS